MSIAKMETSKISIFIFQALIFTWIIGKDSATLPPMNLLPQPSFAEPIPNVTVSAGRDVSLPCVIENLGNYRVAWSHKEKNTLISIQTRVIMRNSRYEVTHQNYKVWYLHIRNVDASDSGRYMCQVNTTPIISQTGYLNVVVAPSIVEEETSSDTNVREGNDASLKCSAYGSPKPDIRWRREDGAEIPTENGKVHAITGTYLNLTKVSRLNIGAYLCIASNGIPPSVSKRIMLNVKFPPMIWIPNQLVGVALGNDVSLDCHLESFPEPVTYWTKGPNHTVVLSGENIDSVVMRSGMYKIQMRLRIRTVTQEDYGAYTCVAKNSLGETEGKIRLYETIPTSTNAMLVEDVIEFKSGIHKEEYSLKGLEYESVQTNSWNSESLNSDWKRPTQKGSIITGDRNCAQHFPESQFLQFILCTILYVHSRIWKR